MSVNFKRMHELFNRKGSQQADRLKKEDRSMEDDGEDDGEFDIDTIEAEFRIEEAKHTKFMLESNAIESEIGLNPGDVCVVRDVVNVGLGTEKKLLAAHKMLTEHLGVSWSGRYRDCEVTVGGKETPKPAAVPYLMAEFFERLPRYTAWEAHNLFEAIHPFQDFNGRVGRLIWLFKALDEYRDPFCLPFLQLYYYETLRYWKAPSIPGFGVSLW